MLPQDAPGNLAGPWSSLVAGGAFVLSYLVVAVASLRVREVDELLDPVLRRARRILPGR